MTRTVFIYWGPHEAHAAWAKSITKEFYPFIPKAIFKTMFNPEDTFTDLFKKTFVHQPLSILNSINIPKADTYLIEGMGCILPVLIKKKKNSKIILINDDTFFYDYQFLSKNKKRIYNKLIKRVDGIISTSNYINNLIPRWVKVPKKIAPLYADTIKFSKIKPNLKQKSIGFVGRLGCKKGIDILIDLFKIILNKDPSYKLYLVGNIYDPLLRKKYNKTKKKTKNKIILTNWIDNPEKYLSRIGTYINPARNEPFGVGIIESMCAGIPPIVTNKSGVAEFVAKISKKLVVEPNINSLFQTFLWLNKDQKRKQLLAKKCKKIASEFTKEKSVAKFKKSFLSMN